MPDLVTQPAYTRSLQSLYEDYFTSANIGQTELRIWMQIRIGMPREPFIMFYRGFIGLFDATKGIKGIEKKNDLINKIEIWARPQPLTLSRFKEGMQLFDEWKQILFENKIIVPMKAG